MAPHPLIGQAAPVISLPDSSGATFTFTPGSSGQPAAILFYPKSGSYGCTQQVCQFRDALAGLTLPHVYAMICAEIPGPLEKDVFKDANIEVIGISPDSVEEQNAFRTKHNLSFPILSDTTGEARKAYGVSRGLMGLTDSSRVTFVLDSKGVVRDSMDATMNFGGHVKFVQKWLDKLAAEKSSQKEENTLSS